ncbi:DEAD/DEAH box helicase [Neomegalonema sp.]|uniref:DEAD/DEAH box helicase n=1 Tax=Neomegalonema sp. TaxID=2039713 RepID=UPI00260ACA06|nr:DEAD/DEAH box helicase [Neomegalonema sp.]MDD2867481.1 DEAD/DEAH box helicase [Neomegalonema sp.]
MTEAFSFVIPRHAVPSDPQTGLSPLQARMIEEKASVRIFSAPTGAGKSYAFQKAMRERNARILFIVPTRRLAQNLMEGLLGDLLDAGLSKEEAQARVFLWTSDGRKAHEEANPEVRFRDLRIRQIRSEIRPDLAPEGLGFMIFATPESVAWYLLNPGLRKDGQDPENPFDLLRLDHVVFDEFHSIDARGMGLSCGLAAIASRMGRTAKITFLSATPIDVRTTLTGFGIEASAIVTAQETVVTGGPEATPAMRALHGDVRVRLEPGTDLPSLLEAHKPRILETLARGDDGFQVVVIYDSIRQLLQDKQALAAWFDSIGVRQEERLSINSSDDSVERDMDGFFTIGRQTDPRKFKVLVATSSVEMGVTFKAGLILMEPGHDACSFVQRLGRAARGDIPGEVVVLLNERALGRSGQAWLRHLPKLLAEEGERISVDRFTDLVLKAIRARFDARPEDLAADRIERDGSFRSMPESAIWGAGLFWAALEQSAHYKGLGGALENFRPQHAAEIKKRLDPMLKSRWNFTKAWAQAFLNEAKKLRMILPKVTLVEPSGKSKSIPWQLYVDTEELRRSPAILDEKGGVRVHVSRPIVLIEGALGGQRVERHEEALFPHKGARVTLPLKDIATHWRRAAAGDIGEPGLSSDKEIALLSAITLVNRTQIVPFIQQDGAEDGPSVIL